MIDKSEKAVHRQLTSDLKRSTGSLQKARRALTELTELKKRHQHSWMNYLQETMKSLKDQQLAYGQQQQDYDKRIAAATEELQAAQRMIQNLGHKTLEFDAAAASDDAARQALAAQESEQQQLLQTLKGDLTAAVTQMGMQVETELGKEETHHVSSEEERGRENPNKKRHCSADRTSGRSPTPALSAPVPPS